MNLALKPVAALSSGTITFTVNDITNPDINYSGIELSGTQTLIGNLNIAIAGTPTDNQTFTVVNNAVITSSSSYHVNIVGIQVADELTNKSYVATAFYNGSTWSLTVELNTNTAQSINGDALLDRSISTSKVELLAITNAEINDVDGSKIAALSINGGTKIQAGTISATELANNAVTSTKILANAVTLAKLATQADATVLGNNSGGTAVPTALTKSDLKSIINYVAPQTVLTVPVSFETAEQCNNTITIPFACTLVSTYVSAYATHAIAGTNNATITLEKNGVAIVGGLITFTASAAINTAGTVSAFSLVTFAAGDTLNLVSAKVTAGGKAIVSIPLVLI